MVRQEGGLFAGGTIDLEERSQTAGSIGREPAANGIARDVQAIGDCVAIINRPKITVEPRAMNKIDDTNTTHEAVLVAAVLAFHALNEAGIALVLDASIDDQTGARIVLDEPTHQVPELPRRDGALAQKIADRVVTDTIEMLGQGGAGDVPWRTEEIFDIA
ncbi:MAG: hypothetical protein KatS3mg057_0925 [Herpetosiphonaceae bacterium]|nr:MAG: hypothetical protein KatS3mg057_0925 [Herpetosiphonaceae bacterium]